ncbi:hypothetical protein MVES1_002003 [Malassezia vespertilionis]|uniref:Dak1p n=1 Tax=Malassezia vespertilionis TaxID=2020962 RepID=A0A2N1JB77_9BASI|nr:uncharacterized protein MVES1_002003 [Malassezia vespertilionis]PKI83794.1 hypothetical protein MVES_001896 [Malassezia vespertilionis]WFD06649.1 hypothetical protein MVES1_002003 [Malassezia vespertilionis]
MSTKHIYEVSNGLVEKAVYGAAASNPSLRVFSPHRVVYDASHALDKVGIIAGGGAGHEPTFTGYVGRGMLTTAVSGDVFASPSAAAISSGVDLTPTEKGLVVIVNNYTGDRLHFGLAAEKARTVFKQEKKGKEVEMVVVGDDVSVGREKGGLVGRRGLTGVAFVCKALGAAAEADWETKKLGEFGRVMVDNIVTCGSSLDHCHVPGREKGDEERGALGPNAIEIGMGIHNEPGVQHIDDKPSSEDLLKHMLKLLLDQNDKDRAYVKFEKSDDPVLVINNLGGMSELELFAIAADVKRLLQSEWGLKPVRVYVGTYITSLNAPGFNITLINHKRIQSATGSDLLSLLAAPADAAGWVGVQNGWSDKASQSSLDDDLQESKERLEAKHKSGFSVSGSATSGARAENGPTCDAAQMGKALQSACEAVIEMEPTLTKYDTIVGDGDAGETLRGCGEAVLAALKENKIPLQRPTAALLGLDDVLESNMGGTSGALYALFFTGLVQGLLSSTKDSSEAASVKHWGVAAMSALENLGNYTPARPGDRTLVDALDPFCRTLDEEGKKGTAAVPAVQAAVKAAKDGAERTRDMTARLGRATYVGETKEKVPDPGAWGVWALVEGLLKSLE